jgi:hypothetical protein
MPEIFIPTNPAHEGITHIAGVDWKWTREQVIYFIEIGRITFYTWVGGRRADVGVVNGPNAQYARTYTDGHLNDYLLAPPERCIEQTSDFGCARAHTDPLLLAFETTQEALLAT